MTSKIAVEVDWRHFDRDKTGCLAMETSPTTCPEFVRNISNIRLISKRPMTYEREKREKYPMRDLMGGLKIE